MTQRSFALETLDAWWARRSLDLHTAMPCRVLAYDASAQTVDVRPQIGHVVQVDGEPVTETLPDLYGIPVAFPRGGGFHVSFPMAVDDYVLVVFSEEPTITWRAKAREVDPGIRDRHGLNGAFAMPMGYPDSGALDDASASNLAIGLDGDNAQIHITPSGSVLIGADATKKAARVGDTVQVTIPPGSFLTAATGGVLNATPVKVDGEITGGSDTVKISD